MQAGILVNWGHGGFGFVKRRNPADGEDVFLHRNHIVNFDENDPPRKGDVVLFDVEHDEGAVRDKAIHAILIPAAPELE